MTSNQALTRLLLILAAICFTASTIGIPARINLVSAGLLCVVLALLAERGWQ